MNKGSHSQTLRSGPIDYSMEERFTVAIDIQYSRYELSIKARNIEFNLTVSSILGLNLILTVSDVPKRDKQVLVVNGKYETQSGRLALELTGAR
ncbi:hypothetical protein [Methylobacter sp.]|uniref:hypothetical protein n=1 Tax=Methylobacter sp. TaxID=2051955 RepID=UPI003DA61BFD